MPETTKIVHKTQTVDTGQKYKQKSANLLRKFTIGATLASSLIASLHNADATERKHIQKEDMRYYTLVGSATADPNFHTNRLRYEITAIKNKDPKTLVVYEVNGKTDKNYWYQVGFGYYNYGKEFIFAWEGFDDKKASVLGKGKSFGYVKFPNVKEGDTIILELAIKKDKIIFYARDKTTNQIVEFDSGTTSTKFVGTTEYDTTTFTGPMTEVISTDSAKPQIPLQKYHNLSEKLPSEDSIILFQQKLESISTKDALTLHKVDYKLNAYSTQSLKDRKWPINQEGSPETFITGGG